METKAKLFNKILANQIQEHMKKIIHHNQVGSIPEIQRCFDLMQITKCTQKKQIERQSTHYHFIRCRKGLLQNLKPFNDKKRKP